MKCFLDMWCADQQWKVSIEISVAIPDFINKQSSSIGIDALYCTQFASGSNELMNNGIVNPLVGRIVDLIYLTLSNDSGSKKAEYAEKKHATLLYCYCSISVRTNNKQSLVSVRNFCDALKYPRLPAVTAVYIT